MMKFLYPQGGTDDRYGTLVSPSMLGIPKSVKEGKPWASDNDAFTKGFQLTKLLDFLETLIPYRSTCLFVAIPDSVSNWVETVDRFRWCAWKVKSMGFPVAFVAQDGCEFQGWPPEYDALFVGGSTDWKLSDEAVHCIRRAQKTGKHIHIGRVNYWKRYSHFKVLKGYIKFTCDGTRVRYEKKAKKKWREYEQQPPLFTI